MTIFSTKINIKLLFCFILIPLFMQEISGGESMLKQSKGLSTQDQSLITLIPIEVLSLISSYLRKEDVEGMRLTNKKFSDPSNIRGYTEQQALRNAKNDISKGLCLWQGSFCTVLVSDQIRPFYNKTHEWSRSYYER